jgi:hypothetical protein
MNDLEESVDRVAAESGFSGVVRVDRGDGAELAKADGLAIAATGSLPRSLPSTRSRAAARD